MQTKPITIKNTNNTVLLKKSLESPPQIMYTKYEFNLIIQPMNTTKTNKRTTISIPLILFNEFKKITKQENQDPSQVIKSFMQHKIQEKRYKAFSNFGKQNLQNLKTQNQLISNNDIIKSYKDDRKY